MASAGDRESLSTDVVIVGAGPSGLAAAIRIKQKYPDLAVTVVEKAAEVGGHILSGAVMDPKGLDALLPEWRLMGAPVGPKVTEDRFHFLTAQGGITLPHLIVPPMMQTPDGVIVSLGHLCRWLAEQATGLGVEIYPMTAAVDVVTGEKGEVLGIITGDLGVDHDGKPKDSFAQGIALLAKYTLIAEGARGSLAKKIIPAFGLDAGKSPQKYGLGIKEVWEIPAEKHQPGRVDHYLGFPLDNTTGGGGFCYHAEDRKIYLGLVVHLDYANPMLSPFDEFQRFKRHKAIAPLLEEAHRISYGARTMTSGGWQSIPDLAFPGGALIGCAAGFMNTPRLKAIHNAILSGIAAGDAVGAAIAEGRSNDWIETLQDKVLSTGIEAELKPVRNMKPLWSRFGTLVGGVLLAGFDMWTNQLFKFSIFGTLAHKGADYAALRPKAGSTEHRYERPDGVTTFDRPASVFLANLSHDEDQPVHLVLDDPAVPIRDNLPRYGEPAPLYCPAGVYEVAEEGGAPVFRIHAANCVHCKTCDIKDPAQNITWVPPEGGSGPNYSGM
ncbi:electron-transferring-flavoprotein dehydrogenase [Youhaiella tibetensis]|uniref:Electron transfer flavoprotein-ubiquinone oxidoreductase n=1 Tax=Paradevosia tibetensis TaxID=1447062 RepID=A0A5B9DLU2_9HYPH|nr:electron transfer flavoprotein-ubiquinone oxidoreductase [Youhaiella tibetensis]QEE19639.1 electron transfer flavoprotein-ubiquinone oxidoreductase [Youhaiella tibetensis]GGF31301.1 electron-transferring-flavoprotein dehydrogenase [Youhaiella tibetensis]